MRLFNFLVLFTLTQVGQAQDEWLRISDPVVDISFDMYGYNTISEDTVYLDNNGIERLSWTSYIQDTAHANFYYSIRTSSYPLDYVHSDSSFALIEVFLNSSVEDFRNNPNYEAILEGYALQDGYPGKYFRYRGKKSETLIECRSYLVGSQLVEMVVGSGIDRWFNQSKQRFISSLSFGNRQKNTVDYGFTVIDTQSYRIDFPQAPVMQDMYLDSDVGRLNSRMYILEKDIVEGNFVYIASETKYPRDFNVETKGLDQFYEDSINGSLRATNGKLVKQEEVWYDNHPGVEFHVSLMDGTLHSVYRTFFINNRTYMYGVMSVENTKDDDALAFFDSFKIVK